jgi:hypothetical protein
MRQNFGMDVLLELIGMFIAGVVVMGVIVVRLSPIILYFVALYFYPGFVITTTLLMISLVLFLIWSSR